ncbi:hypothetical protein [Paractinoplanes brasiliensis]|uniref:hypothetical protein n=1 Tax=Paractinoplanes brasiliensis TaxID=52695 RepID=UPI0010619B96|nr:hypothetical protein [Actinoplanes brasiliensis]GID27776.1 hypothetical protein Abr02nite_27590 [Actinoplanes brasiliensis]
MAGFPLGIVTGAAAGPLAGPADVLGYGLVFGLFLGLVAGLIDKAGVTTPNPRSAVGRDFATALAAGSATTLAFGLPGLAVEFRTVPGVGLADGLLFGFLFMLWYAIPTGFPLGLGVGLAFGFGLTGPRYLALLLCTRRWSGKWLPWRLCRFLDLCHRAGLVRIAGNGYQFRHGELQDYLARQPQPTVHEISVHAVDPRR